MNVATSWDMRDLSRSIGALQRATGRDMPDLVNDTAKFVAIKAYKATIAADANSIKSILNAPSSKNPKHTLAEMIMARRFRGKGSWPKGKGAVKLAATAFIGRRVRSRMWLKAGFIPAFRAFGSRGGVKKFKNVPGGAIRAKQGRNPTAVIEHLDEGFVEQYPNVLGNAVRGQVGFLEWLARKQLKGNLRKAGFR